MKLGDPSDPVEEYVRDIAGRKKYAGICEDTIRDVIIDVLPRYKRPKDALKAARAKLHRIQAAYLGKNIVGECLDEVRTAFARGDVDAVKQACLRMMEQHASTRERIPILDRFYQKIFAVTGVPETILDLACGMHPLGVPWMDLPKSVGYLAFEIARDFVDSVKAFLEAIEVPSEVRFQDIICRTPEEPADLAFLMKMVPCLERRRKGISKNLIARLNVRYVVTTFPVRSLSGRSKNMPAFYTEMFESMIDGFPWQLAKIPMEGELVFVVDKGSDAGSSPFHVTRLPRSTSFRSQ